MQQICTVLLVENNADDAQLAQLAFERAKLNHSLMVVSDGAEAMDYLKGRGAYADRSSFPIPHLILLDLAMPGVGGLGFLEQLRQEPGLRHIPVTILSGSSYSPDLKRAYALGASSFLEKTADLKKLSAAIKQLIEMCTATAATSSTDVRLFSS